MLKETKKYDYFLLLKETKKYDYFL